MKPFIMMCAAAGALLLGMTACSARKPGSAAHQPPAPNSGGPGTAPAPGAKLSYSQFKVPGPYIAITFDDGPVPANTPRLLDMLRQRGIKATFFVVGSFAVRSPQIIRRIIADGHEIANHTWTHRALTSLGDSGVRSELRRSHDLIVQVAGAASAPHMFRPPGGAITARQKTWIMGEFGYPCILWSIDPRDWEPPQRGGCKGQPWELTRRIVSQAKPGDIILVHDLHASSVDAMPATLDGLLAKGFRFLTMSQIIALSQGHALPGGQGGHGLANAPTVKPPPLFTPGGF
ncbi:MAG: polysaccharide deacetylase family protein [Verrucomicrobiaceae bacterium]|nr:MAG: polysaccharide deacetylase family protein [Verrucomicrobiaceae bacterium]